MSVLFSLSMSCILPFVPYDIIPSTNHFLNPSISSFSSFPNNLLGLWLQGQTGSSFFYQASYISLTINDCHLWAIYNFLKALAFFQVFYSSTNVFISQPISTPLCVAKKYHNQCCLSIYWLSRFLYILYNIKYGLLSQHR